MAATNAANATNGAMSSWIEQQQRRIQQLEAENAELRRQLDDLQRGVGIALMIQGRAIPLTALPQVRPSPPIYSPITDAPHALPRIATGLPASNVSANAATRPPYVSPQPMPSPIATPAPFPEDAWLSDSGSALMSPSRIAPVTPLATVTLRHGASSQDVTPSWLRENSPVPRSSQFNAAARPRTQANFVPSTSRLDPAPMRTLAQITGQQQAVRQRAPVNRRSPFSDNFVFG